MTQQQFSMVGVGEVLWDMLPGGSQFGGAPANFACHASQLGARSAMVSCVGRDELGNRAIEELANHKIETKGIARCNLPTGAVEVQLDDQGIPSYKILTDVAWDQIPWSEQVTELAASADVACFGTLGQRSAESRRTIRRFLAEMPRDSLRIFDINLRASFYDDAIILDSLKLANVLKLNDEELVVVSKICGLSGTESELLQQLATRFELRTIALTCGSRGASILNNGELSQQAAADTNVVDTVGAGDAFTAALAVGLAAGLNLDTINLAACQLAAFVCSQAGAVPTIPDELKAWTNASKEESSP